MTTEEPEASPARPAGADPRAELALLVAALGAHLDRLAATGASGLAASSRPRSAPEAHQAEADAPAARARPARAPAGPAGPPAAAPPPPPVGREEARQRLTALAAEVAGCTRCGLHERRTQTVFARGNGTSGLCFVGEGPGFDEDKQGLPFVGKAGQLLDRMIAAMGLDREEVYVCNIVKCRPPDNRKPEADEMAACRPFLKEQLALVQPSVIVALGATAVDGLLGLRGGITRLRGSWRLYEGRIAVMPTFHPAYLLRNPKAKRDVWNDLQEVLRHMGRPIPSKKSGS